MAQFPRQEVQVDLGIRINADPVMRRRDARISARLTGAIVEQLRKEIQLHHPELGDEHALYLADMCRKRLQREHLIPQTRGAAEVTGMRS